MAITDLRVWRVLRLLRAPQGHRSSMDCKEDIEKNLCIEIFLLQRFVEKHLHFAEQLHAVLFHDDGVRAFADFNVAFRRRILQ